MSILCDHDLRRLMMDSGLIEEPDYDLLNPASIDIRVGRHAILELGHGRWNKVELSENGTLFEPGVFALVETMEIFRVPNGYAMDLRLKSSTARLGWDHSLAFWVDPGWQGVLTMEVRNVLRYNSLLLRPGDRFAQAIVHRLSGDSDRLYAGRYNGARSVEGAKI